MFFQILRKYTALLNGTFKELGLHPVLWAWAGTFVLKLKLRELYPDKCLKFQIVLTKQTWTEVSQYLTDGIAGSTHTCRDDNTDMHTSYTRSTQVIALPQFLSGCCPGYETWSGLGPQTLLHRAGPTGQTHVGDGFVDPDSGPGLEYFRW